MIFPFIQITIVQNPRDFRLFIKLSIYSDLGKILLKTQNVDIIQYKLEMEHLINLKKQLIHKLIKIRIG